MTTSTGTRREARRRALVKYRPSYAQRDEGFPETDLVSQQDDLSAPLLILVQALEDGVDRGFLPLRRLLDRNEIAVAEHRAKRTPQVESIGTRDHGCSRCKAR